MHIKDLPLPLQMFMVDNTYTGSTEGNIIGVTTLILPMRQLLLRLYARNLPKGQGLVEFDPVLQLPSRIGTSVHKVCEDSISLRGKENLQRLGFSQEDIDNCLINPPDGTEIDPEELTFYTENRVDKEINGYIISGEYDGIFDGTVYDFKCPSTYVSLKGNDWKYKMQLSLLKWLNPDKVHSPLGYIYEIVRDYRVMESKTKRGVLSPFLTYPYHLLTHQECDLWVNDRINKIKQYLSAGIQNFPLCADDDLWRDPTVYKAYSKANHVKAKGTFNTYQEASNFLFDKYTSEGVVREIKSKAKCCNYCDVRLICSQYTSLKEANQV